MELGVHYSTWGWEGDLVSKVLNGNLQKSKTTTTTKPKQTSRDTVEREEPKLNISTPLPDIRRVKFQNLALLMIYIYLA